MGGQKAFCRVLVFYHVVGFLTTPTTEKTENLILRKATERTEEKYGGHNSDCAPMFPVSCHSRGGPAIGPERGQPRRNGLFSRYGDTLTIMDCETNHELHQ